VLTISDLLFCEQTHFRLSEDCLQCGKLLNPSEIMHSHTRLVSCAKKCGNIRLTYLLEFIVCVQYGPNNSLSNHCIAGVHFLCHEEEVWGLNVD
jgi:hypothetical protein